MDILIPPQTELIGIAITIQPQTDIALRPQYTTALHGWFLDCVRRTNPTLSQQLHDGQDEKPFTISGLWGEIPTIERQLQLSAQQSYQWQITAFSRPLCDWLRQWLTKPPRTLRLNTSICKIIDWQISLPATTYAEIWQQAATKSSLELTFTSPTSFRKRKNHMPLPIPENVFQSYLRRWNHFASQQFNPAEFLEWVNEYAVILRHEIRSSKVQAGKSGSVRGFIGRVQFGLTPTAKNAPQFKQLAYALIQSAPYFQTGHKVTFGLGQTQLGWLDEVSREDRAISIAPSHSEPASLPSPDIAARERELEQIFLGFKKRQGGERARKTAKLWAQIIIRLESGNSLKEIAIELQMPYDTAKKYAQIAKQQLNSHLELKQSY
jgi:CRISPR-associated endoribonuclease Cas6